MLYTLCLILASMACLNGQVSERDYQLSLGSQNAFVTEHENVNKKTVQKYLEKAIKEFGKVKRNRKADEWHCMQCDVPGLSAPADVYFRIDEGKAMTTSYVFVDDGSGFVSSDSNPDLAKSLSSRLQLVKYDITRHAIGEELKDEEGNLKDRNKDLEKLEKKNKDLHNDIEKYKKKISEAEAGIEKNLQEQEDKKIEIEQQKKLVGEVTERYNNVGKN